MLGRNNPIIHLIRATNQTYKTVIVARPTRQGIDYFPYDVDLDQDDKLGMIIGEFQIKGEILYTKLCAWIYKTNGYYTEWNEEVQLRFLRRYDYCGFSVSFTNEVVPRLIKWGLFDKAVFDSFQILTSARIQETWKDATRKRKDCIIDEKIRIPLVIDADKPEETKKKPEETPQSKGKESKEKERKGEPPPEINDYGEVSQCYDIEKELTNNQIYFQKICMAAQKDEETGRRVLKKYHLSMIENEKYPRSKKSLYAGFEKWLMDEKSYRNVKPGTKQIGRDFIPD